jgi:transposase
MIQIAANMRIVLAVEPVDFRKGIDGLAALCRNTLRDDPFSGALFVFVNRRKTAVRILVFDGQGYWLCHKRLSTGRFLWNFSRDSGHKRKLAALQLQQLLWNVRMDSPEIFRPIS